MLKVLRCRSAWDAVQHHALGVFWDTLHPWVNLSVWLCRDESADICLMLAVGCCHLT